MQISSLANEDSRKSLHWQIEKVDKSLYQQKRQLQISSLANEDSHKSLHWQIEKVDKSLYQQKKTGANLFIGK